MKKQQIAEICKIEDNVSGKQTLNRFKWYKIGKESLKDDGLIISKSVEAGKWQKNNVGWYTANFKNADTDNGDDDEDICFFLFFPR